MEISRQLSDISAFLKVQYTYNSKPMTYEEVFSTTGLLPGLAKRADQLCSLCLGYGIGVTFDEAQKAVLGTEVKFDEATPEALRLLCLTDVLQELIKAAPNKELVALDELMYD